MKGAVVIKNDLNFFLTATVFVGFALYIVSLEGVASCEELFLALM